MGLHDLPVTLRDRSVSRAWLCCLPPSWWLDMSRADWDVRAAETVADTVLHLMEGGNANLARKLVRVFQHHAHLADDEPDDEPLDYIGYPELFDHLNLHIPRDLFVLADFAPWRDFADGCDLADRIDNFLAASRGGKTQTALVEACRHDLNLLLVLADWCDENKLPMTAAEARHLHRLVRSYL